MIEVQPDLDSTLRRRFAVPAEEARVRRTAAALEANGITVLRARNSAEAKRIVLDLIPAGSQVHQGASQSLDAAGITDEIERSGARASPTPGLQHGPCDAGRRDPPPQRLTRDHARQCPRHHRDRTLVAASVSGSQLGPYVSGAGKVILWLGRKRSCPTSRRTAAHRRVRFPARGCACSGCLRHPQ